MVPPASLSLLAAPPTSLLIKRAAGITVGSGTSGTKGAAGVSGTISMKHVYEIAKIKLLDVPGVDEKPVSERAREKLEGNQCAAC